MAVLSSVFFIASLIHVPVGPSAAHLILNGVCGLLLGWMAFPAILVGLALHALLFQFGGLTTLGVNTFNMAFPQSSFITFAGEGCGVRFGRTCGCGVRSRGRGGACFRPAGSAFVDGNR